MRLRSGFAVAFCAALSACGARTRLVDLPYGDADAGPALVDASPGCGDEDGDEYGVGSDCREMDCDDLDPEVHAQEDCDARCARGVYPGCACETREPAACYGGPPGTSGVGLCRGGLTSCRSGVWSPCEGQVLPADEVCDDVDNDCDGPHDEGVRNTCGTCEPDCAGHCWSPSLSCEDWGSRLDRVTRTAEGWLVVDESEGPGTWVGRVDCGMGGAVWFTLRVDAYVPPDTTLEMSVRTASIVTQLDAAPWSIVKRIPPSEPEIDLVQELALAGATHGSAIDLRIVLYPSGGVSPTLHQVSLESACDHDSPN